MSIVAYGGTGKSALVNRWLESMHNDDYRQATKVFAWSFYSQGTKENLVSADPFVSFALSWLGDEDARSLNPWARGERLADLIKQHHCLLILDSHDSITGEFDDHLLLICFGCSQVARLPSRC